MWADLTKSLLPTWLRSDPDDTPLNERALPIINDLPLYALRGYRGPDVVISNSPYPGAHKASDFCAAHVADLAARKTRISPRFIERDAQVLLEMTSAGPVRIVPAY